MILCHHLTNDKDSNQKKKLLKTLNKNQIYIIDLEII